jgi:anaerobic magnesium-protoporphyrin IX monomethyl ester cyclase
VHLHLVGADHEENLGIGMIAAAARAAEHRVEVLPFNRAEQLERLALEIADADPQVVGLSMQFQHRGHEFLALARRLRGLGYAGHITCGGQFATAAHREVLGDGHGVDSVVLHEGEQTIRDLLAALRDHTPLSDVRGVAFRSDGEITRTKGRCLVADLDALPFPARYRAHGVHVGVPFVPLLGSRGCWGACSFCSITEFYKDAQRAGGGKRLRHRSPQNIAQEMALLAHASGGGRGIFCFHDDNFLMPRPADSLARVRELRQHLDSYEVSQVALIGKCRPDSLTPELARELRELGVVRLYVGVENTSEGGSEHLERRVDVAQVGRALDACREAGIFTCYNLLLFEPQATLDDIEANIAFIRDHDTHPVNFCRAEPYYGTPLHRQLEAAGALGGSYLGYDYRIADNRAELCFRIAAAAFRERNFGGQGVHNRYMGLGYMAVLLDQFYRDQAPKQIDELVLEAELLTRTIVNETADLLEEAWRLAKTVDLDDRETIERETALLGLRIAAADRYRHARLDEVYANMERLAEGFDKPPKPRFARLKQVATQLARGVAIGALLSAWGVGAAGCDDDRQVKQDMTVVDPPPQDAGIDGMIVDPLPADQGVDVPPPDPPPPDAGFDIPIADPAPVDQGVDVPVVDMLPPDQGVDMPIADPLPPDASAVLPVDPGDARLALRDAPAKQETSHWRDTSPKQATRSADLPLFAPPSPRIEHHVGDDGAIEVAAANVDGAASYRWESDGEVLIADDGDGQRARWRPESSADQLRLGVRTRGGVAVVTLLAKHLELT